MTCRCKLVALAVIGLSLCDFPAVTSPVLAGQTAGQTEIDSLAHGKDATAQRELGEKLVYGQDVAQDKAAGRLLLEAAIANGDVQAMAILGKMLIEGYYFPADAATAVPLLEKAAAAGNAKAETALGTALLFGTNVPAERKRAKALLSQAADQGNRDAQRVLGEQLVYGTVLPADQAKGVSLLKEAVKANDKKAQVVLGTLYLNGKGVAASERRARALFEMAAAAGDGEGLERYGRYLLAKPNQFSAARSYLHKAALLGRDSAWTALAEAALWGQLGKGSRAEYEGYAAKARAAGQPHIAVLDAERRIWGIGEHASGPEAVAMLEKAARQGNAEAALYLIGLVRDGNHYNVRKSPAEATAYIDAFGKLLSREQIRQQRLLVRAASDRTPSGISRLAATIGRNPAVVTADFAEQLCKANPNLAVHLLQRGLKARGLYSGEDDGLLTRPTMQAMYSACRKLSGGDVCTGDQITAAMVGVLLSRLAATDHAK